MSKHQHQLSEVQYWNRFEEEASKYGVPFWVDYQKANTPEIGFINFSTDSLIDSIVLGQRKAEFINSVVKVLKNKAANKEILDLGCGAGWLCLELARKGAKVKGIDTSSKRIEIATNYAKKEKQNIKYIVDDIEELKWARKEGNLCIVNWNSFHHVKDLDRLLKTIINSLDKGGLFVSWDYLGDNFLIKLATNLASLIPGFYKQKKAVLIAN